MLIPLSYAFGTLIESLILAIVMWLRSHLHSNIALVQLVTLGETDGIFTSISKLMKTLLSSTHTDSSYCYNLLQ